MRGRTTVETCPDCGVATAGALSFCRECGHYLPDQALELRAASLWRRFFANLLDGLLTIVTLIVGWLVWFFFTAKDGQTPGKKILGIRCVALNGSAATAGTMWVREVAIKALLWGIFLGSFLLNWLPYLWAFWDKDKQALHDKMVNTLVVNVPEVSPRRVARERVAREQAAPSSDRGDVTTTPTPSSATVQEELQRLASLREQGLITPDEFEEKRKRLAADL